MATLSRAFMIDPLRILVENYSILQTKQHSINSFASLVSRKILNILIHWIFFTGCGSFVFVTVLKSFRFYA